MNIMESINLRQSIRNYETKPISDEDLKEVLEAGRLAPSARNAQAWKFIAVTDPKVNMELRPACHNQNMVGEAPVTIAICSNNTADMTCGHSKATVDCSIALSFMMLRAVELGLSTCWLGHFDQDMVKSVLNIPDDYTVVAMTPLGYAANTPTKTPRKPLDEIVSYNKFE